GLAALERAERLDAPPGPYRLQALIARAHAEASHSGATDWVRIAALYEALFRIQPGPVVALNRAVAHGKAFGPQRGLAMVEAIAAEGALARYALLEGVRGHFLEALGRGPEAAAAFRAALALTTNE